MVIARCRGLMKRLRAALCAHPALLVALLTAMVLLADVASHWSVDRQVALAQDQDGASAEEKSWSLDGQDNGSSHRPSHLNHSSIWRGMKSWPERRESVGDQAGVSATIDKGAADGDRIGVGANKRSVAAGDHRVAVSPSKSNVAVAGASVGSSGRSDKATEHGPLPWPSHLIHSDKERWPKLLPQRRGSFGYRAGVGERIVKSAAGGDRVGVSANKSNVGVAGSPVGINGNSGKAADKLTKDRANAAIATELIKAKQRVGFRAPQVAKRKGSWRKLRLVGDYAPSMAVTTIDYTVKHITVGKTQWRLASKYVLLGIPNSIALPIGLVIDANGSAYTLKHWYWEEEVHRADRSGLVKRAGEKCPEGQCPELFSALGYGQDMFQHMTLDMLPKVALACDFLQKNSHIKILAGNQLQAALLYAACPVSPESRIQVGNDTHGSIIYVPQWLPPLAMGLAQFGVMRPLGRPFVTADLLDVSHAPQKGLSSVRRIIYLQRGPREKRSVLNEAEVLHALNATGAKLEVLSKLSSWKRDRVLFQDAHYIVGPHGGAFGNLVFASPGAVVVEFGPLGHFGITSGETGRSGPIEMRPAFLGLAVALGLRYEAIPTEDPPKFRYGDKMRVDVKKLEEFFARESATWS